MTAVFSPGIPVNGNCYIKYGVCYIISIREYTILISPQDAETLSKLPVPQAVLWHDDTFVYRHMHVSHPLCVCSGQPSAGFLFLDGGSTVDATGADDDVSNSKMNYDGYDSNIQDLAGMQGRELPDQTQILSLTCGIL